MESRTLVSSEKEGKLGSAWNRVSTTFIFVLSLFMLIFRPCVFLVSMNLNAAKLIQAGTSDFLQFRVKRQCLPWQFQLIVSTFLVMHLFVYQ